MNLKNKKWIYRKHPEGLVSDEHYELVSEDLPLKIGPDKILIKSKFISVDPYMRIQQSQSLTWEEPHPLNIVQRAGVVAEVVESSDTSRFQKGEFVRAYTGWQQYAVCHFDEVKRLDPEVAPVSTALGILGMPARTAYFGLMDAGKILPRETIVVSGCAGAVGTVACQLAKLKGCHVVGLAGSQEKTDYLTQELNIDVALNYKTHNSVEKMTTALKAACPRGIDVYFDNTGGFISDAIYPLINLRARIIICGQISQYNGGLDHPELGPRFLHHILYKRATIQGILARDYTHREQEMLSEIGPLVKSGKVKYRETFIDGFEKLPQALNALFAGKNTGKLIVRVY